MVLGDRPSHLGECASPKRELMKVRSFCLSIFLRREALWWVKEHPAQARAPRLSENSRNYWWESPRGNSPPRELEKQSIKAYERRATDITKPRLDNQLKQEFTENRSSILARANWARLGENSRKEILGCVCTSRPGESCSPRRGFVKTHALQTYAPVVQHMCSSSYVPVAYTHREVYKRQQQDLRARSPTHVLLKLRTAPHTTSLNYAHGTYEPPSLVSPQERNRVRMFRAHSGEMLCAGRYVACGSHVLAYGRVGNAANTQEGERASEPILSEIDWGAWTNAFSLSEEQYNCVLQGVKHVAFYELWLRMTSLELWLGIADEHEELLSCGSGWRVLPVCQQDILRYSQEDVEHGQHGCGHVEGNGGFPLMSPYLLVFGDDHVRGIREQMILQVVLVRHKLGAWASLEIYQSFNMFLNQL
ncbi:hypothetical protein DEO72_LG7g1483 [Vigna unguiculata]|uniref:Uncharacterized protein n=1 Tax=Vigna unguiculata TaxID=3917 RepID=A0A4D6MFR3_VIGUN|nr:hypothetical protein DEO72_LG7g1483 [Vigna unguiculata]